MPADIILLQPRTRLLQKARHYVQHPNRFLAELDIALDLLIKALRYADHNLKCRILMLLGGIAHNEVAEALLRVMRDGLENEETRLQAAIQHSITVPALANRRSWTYRLLEDLSQKDESQKRFAALALDRLSELSAERLAPVKAEINALDRDTDKTVRHAALALPAICAP